MHKLPFDTLFDWKHFQGLHKDPIWKNTTDGIENVVFSALSSGNEWYIRMNNFPKEPVYTLIIEDEEIIHFDEWPDFWQKPE